MATVSTLGNIKKLVEKSIGQDITLRTNRGRKKFYVKQGKVVATYPCVFIVNVDCGKNSERKVSYTYSDLLTSTVEITFDESQRDLLA